MNNQGCKLSFPTYVVDVVVLPYCLQYLHYVAVGSCLRPCSQRFVIVHPTTSVFVPEHTPARRPTARSTGCPCCTVVVGQEQSEKPACSRRPFTGKLVADAQMLFGMLSDVARAPSRAEKQVGLYMLRLVFLVEKWTMGKTRGNLIPKVLLNSMKRKHHRHETS